MGGIGKSSVWMATGFVMAGGLLILAPTEASAQFPNIDSIIRGAMQHPYGGGYYRGSGSSHHSKSHDDSSNNAPVKEKDATQDESQTANGGARTSGTSQNTIRSQTSDAAPQSSGPPSRVTNDQPSFAPSR
jgi:hypothetical protein